MTRINVLFIHKNRRIANWVIWWTKHLSQTSQTFIWSGPWLRPYNNNNMNFEPHSLYYWPGTDASLSHEKMMLLLLSSLLHHDNESLKLAHLFFVYNYNITSSCDMMFNWPFTNATSSALCCWHLCRANKNAYRPQKSRYCYSSAQNVVVTYMWVVVAKYNINDVWFSIINFCRLLQGYCSPL